MRWDKACLAQHHDYIQNKDNSQATGQHFNLPGHSLADLMVTIIEKNQKHYIERKEKSTIPEGSILYIKALTEKYKMWGWERF